MEYIEKSSKSLKEKYYKIMHESGLAIYVYPKEGYTSSYAIFGTNYGSVNNCFSVDGGPKKIVPFSRYAETGASANAYTSFDKTCYLFSSTDNFLQSLEILLDFVQDPYFTKETVEKEQGIIAQEIKMYDDSPQWRVFFNLLKALYVNHPVNVDIAGTVESISNITDEILYDCYHTFYNLSNMVLCVAGDVNIDEVMSLADKMLKKSDIKKVESFFEDEPYKVASDYIEQEFSVSVDLFQLGYKEKTPSKRISERESALTDIILFAIASNSSDLYNELLKKELINATFSFEYLEGPMYRATILGGESRNPKMASDYIINYIKEKQKTGITQEEFEIAKNAIYGTNVSTFNSISSIANMLVEFHFTDKETFKYMDCFADITLDEVNIRFKEQFDSENVSLSVVKNKG